MRVFLLRHGQSQANVAQLISSRPEVATTTHGLTERGREQAREAGRSLRRQIFESQTSRENSKEDAEDKIGNESDNRRLPVAVVVVASDFLRTRQTACEAIRELGVLESDSCGDHVLNFLTLVTSHSVTPEEIQGETERNSPKQLNFDSRLRERFFGELHGCASNVGKT